MHAITTSNLVEIIGEDGRPSRSATGRIAVTPLDNHGMCLLRYALDDTARWGRDCPCGRGFPVLVGLRGKPGRLIRLPSGRSVSATAFMMMHLLEGILEYQIIQEKTDRFSFLYVPAAAELPPETRRKAEKMIREACLNEKICLSLEKTGKIPKGKTGKHEAVLSLVDE
jgi:phenylacetate-CoA ligase